MEGKEIIQNDKNNQSLTVTHYGEWVIDGDDEIVIECYVTNDAKRIMSLRGTARAMGLKGGGSSALVRNLKSQYLQPYLSEKLQVWISKVENNEIERVQGDKGNSFIPFEGDLFVDVCKAYIKANKDGVLNKNQAIIADKLLSIMSAFAKVGIVALIDEITGYQDDREKDELQKILAKYVREEFLPWTQRFPTEFYVEMFRLRGWEYKGKPKPPYVGKLTNQIVYDVLPNNVLDELKIKNPKLNEKGYRRYKLHQFLTEETGVPHLDKHLASVVTLMRVCDTWEEFENLFNKAFKKDEE